MGLFLLAIYAVGALAICGWALVSSRGGGAGDAVFASIFFGVGLSWPIIVAALILCLLGFLLLRRRWPAGLWS